MSRDQVRVDRGPRPWFYGTALLVGLPATYLLSDGPGWYAVERGWLTKDEFLSVWGPIPDWVGLAIVDRYEGWWADLAATHGGPASRGGAGP